MPFESLPSHDLQIRQEQFQPLPAIQRYPILPFIAEALKPLAAKLDEYSPEGRQKKRLEALDLNLKEAQLHQEQQKLNYLSLHPELAFGAKTLPKVLTPEEKDWYDARTKLAISAAAKNGRAGATPLDPHQTAAAAIWGTAPQSDQSTEAEPSDGSDALTQSLVLGNDPNDNQDATVPDISLQ